MTFQKAWKYARIVLVGSCIIAGLASFVSIGEVLGDALGKAYATPLPIED
jgi:hypothetical protein